jgi:predicted membrane-bound spermidine synthase
MPSVRLGLRLAAAAIAGAVIMGLELVAFRLYAPYFGYSIYIWGSMIAVIMAALALGYACGGRLADATRTDLPIYASLLVSGLYQAAVLAAIYSLLPVLSRFSDFIGTSVATLVIFAPPMTALAMVSPLVIRRLAQSEHVGVAAGTVTALATVGSMGGILSTSFFLLPEVGVRVTLELLCGATLLAAAVGLVQTKPVAIAGLAVVAALPFVPPPRWPADTVSVAETPYNLLRVARRGSNLILFLNNNTAQTVRNDRGATGYYYDQFALGPLLVPAERGLVLGMGAGGSIEAAWRSAPGLKFDAVEIDPKVVEAAGRWFGLPKDDPRLHVHIADARRWLARTEARFDLVQLDAYQGGPYIPFYLITEEFFRLARNHMGDDALLMMNLFDASPDRELLMTTAATMKTAFPSLLVATGSPGNHMLYAFTRSRSLPAVKTALRGASTAPAASVANYIAELNPPVSTVSFTDDLAPVEKITRRMLAQLQ